MYQKKYTDSMDELIKQHLHLVTKVVRQLNYKKNPHFDEDDFISVGMIALCEAIQTYDSKARVSFETFAKMKIKWKIVDELRKVNGIPAGRAQQVVSFLKKKDELEQELMREPTDQEIATALSLSQKDLSKTKDAISYFVVYSLDHLVSDDQDINFHDIHLDTQKHCESALNELLRQENLDFLNRAIQCLEPREQLLLQLHFVEEMTFNQISEVLDLSPSRISQLYRKILKTLRAYYLQHKRDEVI